MRYILLLFLLMSLSACSVNSIKLDSQWYPLEKAIERGEAPESLKKYVSDTVTVTVGRNIYVANLEEWEKSYPKGSDVRADLLSHERVHSRRQLDFGLYSWLYKYGTDKNFRLYEEQLGYYVDMKRKMSRGLKLNTEFYAQVMSQSYFGMISYEDAKKWADDVVAGKWTPKDEDLKDIE